MPDPGRPFDFAPKPGATVGRRWLAQTRKRACILASARKCMAAKGLDGVQLRAIAEDCGISVQTIYNIVGDRGRVLRDSSEEWVLLLAAATHHEHDGEPDSSLTFALVEKFWATPLRWPDYVSSGATSSARRPDPLNAPYVSASVRVLRDALLQVQEQGGLRDSVDVGSIARQLTMTTHSMICNWVFDGGDQRQYQRELFNGPALMLLGAFRGAEQHRLERHLARIEARSAGYDAAGARPPAWAAR